MTSDLDTDRFREDLLRLYLGRYANRFKQIKTRSGVVLYTDPHPLLVVQLYHVWVKLSEYIKVEEDDQYYGIFDHYQIDIETVPIEDPDGAEKIETAIAKSFLAGTQS